VTLNGIDIDGTLKELEVNLALEKDLSPTLKSLISLLVLVVKLLTNRVGLNSQNSSKPPASDPNRPKTSRKKSGNKPGGQPGHVGTTLKQIDEPDEIEVLEIDRRKLPRGRYKEVGFERRQVFDIYVARNVIEYQAQILEDEAGARFVAQFPEGVDKAVQYGNSLKAHAVYMSQYQLLPYNRVQEYFTEQLQIPISQGSIFNFNQEAFERLTEFSAISKEKLIRSSRLHADETGINIDGKRHWLHCASNDLWTDFFPHQKRGCEAMDERGILLQFRGVLCHDHRKRSKSRNLLERLINFEDDVLRFMKEADVPFTNNQGENDIRMTKVQQKISGCFRSMEGAETFCRVRGYLSTCRPRSSYGPP
jgi:transposase